MKRTGNRCLLARIPLVEADGTWTLRRRAGHGARKRVAADDHALLEAAETLAVRQEKDGQPRDISNPFESRAIGQTERQYTGEPLTLNLKDADIKDTLQKFSELTNLNILFPGCYPMDGDTALADVRSRYLEYFVDGEREYTGQDAPERMAMSLARRTLS